MKGVATRYPKYDAGAGTVIDLARRINGCVVGGIGAPKLAPESDDLLGLEAYLAMQSRGMPMNVSIEGPAHATWEKGRDLYFTRIGQLNMACTGCHDASWGKTLLAETVSQGQPTGWPAYRLEWQRPGSLQRRLRACFNGVRAAMPPFGSPDLVALELYLAWRAQGLPMESPAVRR
jgi:sulfur-oxidizing protein SoxA